MLPRSTENMAGHIWPAGRSLPTAALNWYCVESTCFLL